MKTSSFGETVKPILVLKIKLNIVHLSTSLYFNPLFFFYFIVFFYTLLQQSNNPKFHHNCGSTNLEL